ncbi:hypothetical protein AAFF_G00286170 [Aldrovandia affinis]|uniref:Uncharacterized protein n=1 Tax=Aldrovandia affinis TaxID=143900 RepID=A0AAD7X210_9TELE|nr:hypothetical protein AAFF_G00286170 [Aldrovandia affinis]
MLSFQTLNEDPIEGPSGRNGGAGPRIRQTGSRSFKACLSKLLPELRLTLSPAHSEACSGLSPQWIPQWVAVFQQPPPCLRARDSRSARLESRSITECTAWPDVIGSDSGGVKCLPDPGAQYKREWEGLSLRSLEHAPSCFLCHSGHD